MGWQMEKATLLTTGLLLLLLLLLLVLQSAEAADVVSLKMRLGEEGSMFVYIHFYNGTFSTFYDCLSSNIWQECSAIFASNNTATQQNYDHYVTSVETSKSISGPSSGYFKCQHDQETHHLVCTRQPADATLCGVGKPTQVSTFQLKEASSDSHTCIGIIWAWPDETITCNNPGLFAKCDPLCMSNSSTENLNDKGKPQHSDDKSKIDTIIAITVTLAVVLGVVVVAIVYWRRSRISTKHDIDNDLGSNGRNSFANSGASMEVDSGLVLQTNSTGYSI